MRFIIQRVSEASVTVEDQTIGKIQKGFLVLIGVSDSDTQETADKLIKKMIGLRIFEDENGKTNLSLADVNGSLLLVSQFTLYANCNEYIITKCRQSVSCVKTGEFGADMKVALVNDGPFTIILDSETL